ncbi:MULTISPECIES: alpha/beta hydrolase [Rhodanobacter]|uniref:alpha/beta hydrolase n=1 Tax=Rhodanobacter TaxID=75309 RepID=UPI00041A1CD4|nr:MULTISPECIES: alpha/beta hydrolase [Rhodanobacter]TAN16274.1 MAG: alpha/beta hydrolase [Rhodanobacter sp.]UJJ54061.1 alpha/beta hydrolase [Rhodanobacter thiooxydans]
MRGQIILSHGSDSGPDATKVSALATLAESLGWRTQRPDYRADDARGFAGSVAPRVARLRATIEAQDAPPLLVGSSMGAFVSGLVSLDVPVAGLLLLATPSEIPGYARKFDLREDVPALLIHGWRDEICPLAGVHAFAAKRRLPLLVLDDDHRLGSSMGMIAAQFRGMLDQRAAAA